MAAHAPCSASYTVVDCPHWQKLHERAHACDAHIAIPFFEYNIRTMRMRQAISRDSRCTLNAPQQRACTLTCVDTSQHGEGGTPKRQEAQEDKVGDVEEQHDEGVTREFPGDEPQKSLLAEVLGRRGRHAARCPQPWLGRLVTLVKVLLDMRRLADGATVRLLLAARTPIPSALASVTS